MKQNRIRKPNAGVNCPRCGVKSELRQHLNITEKLLSQPFYYKQWYQCQNKECRTTTFMEEKDKVVNPVGATREMRKIEERSQQVAFFKSL